jgi:nitrogenase molybdenum-iron protein beta chain
MMKDIEAAPAEKITFGADHSYIERPRYFCSFGGALCTLEALPETIAVLHAAGGCAGSIAWGQNGGSALQTGGFCGGLAVPSSNVGEKEVIFGGADRLAEQIRSTVEMMEAKLFVVITSCVTEMIGDDVQAVVNEVKDDIAIKDASLVFARTGGFKGNSYYGYDIVLSAIARQFVKKGETKKGTVNVFGIVPYMDSFWRGNLEGVKKLLESAGLKVNTFFGEGDSLESLLGSGGAELNIVVSDLYGTETAQVYEELFDIPYISVSLPVGPAASAELLRAVEKKIGLPLNVENLIGAEQKRYWRYLDLLVDCYYDLDLQRYALVIADVNYAVSVTRFLKEDLGWIPVLVQFTELLDDKQRELLAKKVRERGADYAAPEPLVVFDTNSSEAGKYLIERYPRRETDLYVDSLTPAFVVGSSLERDLAAKLGAAHLSVSFPVANRAVINRGYTGFSGGLTLAEDLISAAVAGR